MRKVILFAIPVLVLIVVVITVIIGQAIHHPAGWRTELEKYVRYKSSFIAVQVVTQASKPWYFKRNMSHTTFGEGAFADYNYEGRRQGYRRIPFPPEEVWCVLLRETRSLANDARVETSHAVIFVGYHLDLYHAGWVVHEGETEPFSSKFIEDISRIGCNLSLEGLSLSNIKVVWLINQE
jgi:hypothetical protein